MIFITFQNCSSQLVKKAAKFIHSVSQKYGPGFIFSLVHAMLDALPSLLHTMCAVGRLLLVVRVNSNNGPEMSVLQSKFMDRRVILEGTERFNYRWLISYPMRRRVLWNLIRNMSASRAFVHVNGCVFSYKGLS